MVGVAQLVEPRVVIPVVVGSSPIVHPNSKVTGFVVLELSRRPESIVGDPGRPHFSTDPDRADRTPFDWGSSPIVHPILYCAAPRKSL